MTMTMRTTNSSVLFVRESSKIGDLAAALRAIELTRIANPDLFIAVKCSNPDLLINHPAIDVVNSFDYPSPECDATIILQAAQRYDEPKHKTFCDITARSLRGAGLNPIEWDGLPQKLWTSAEDVAWAKNLLVGRVSPGKIPIGIFWRSDQSFRTWNGMEALASSLASCGKYHVFCFDGSEWLMEPSKCLTNVVGYPLNRVCAIIEQLKLVITPDTGGLHLAGGLGIPFIGLFGATDPDIIAGMYAEGAHFEINCRYHPCWFKQKRTCIRKRCLKAIKPKEVMKLVAQKIPYESGLPTLWGLPNKEPEPAFRLFQTLQRQFSILVVRFRGIGDVGMLWFALAELRKKHLQAHITFLTSPAGAALFCGQEGLVDKVIAIDYKHPTTPGEIPIPIDTSPYDLVFNTINAVDFGDIAYKKSRADNFADLLEVAIEQSPRIQPLVISEAEEAWARERINYEPNDKIITCQLDSMGLSRFWSDHHWLKFSRQLYNYYGRSVKVVFISVKDHHRRLKIPPNVFNLACETSVREYIAMVSISDVLVCTDSAGLHIGGRLPNVKVVGLFGSTGICDNGQLPHTNYYNNIYSIRSNMRCSPCWDWQYRSCRNKRHAPKCLWKIKPQEVFEKVRDLFASTTDALNTMGI